MGWISASGAIDDANFHSRCWHGETACFAVSKLEDRQDAESAAGSQHPALSPVVSCVTLTVACPRGSPHPSRVFWGVRRGRPVKGPTSSGLVRGKLWRFELLLGGRASLYAEDEHADQKKKEKEDERKKNKRGRKPSMFQVEKYDLSVRLILLPRLTRRSAPNFRT